MKKSSLGTPAGRGPHTYATKMNLATLLWANTEARDLYEQVIAGYTS